MLKYSPDAYDPRGQLRLPLSFWAIVLLQARTWVLFVMAGASRQQGNTLLALFYPDMHTFWSGIAAGCPAAIALLLTGYRQRFPRLWQSWRWVLIVSLVVMLCLQGMQLWSQAEQTSPWVLLVFLLDGLALMLLLCQQRLRDCFNPQLNH